MNTPSKEYKDTLAAVVLSVFGAAFEWKIPKSDDLRKSPAWRNDQRVIANRPSKACLEHGKRINTGGYKPWFLDTVPGLEYEVRMEKIHTQGLSPEEVDEYFAALQARARRASFAFVEGGTLTYIYAWSDNNYIRTWEEFGDACGIKIGNGAKIAKRLKEIVRTTRMFVRLGSLDIRLFETDFPKLAQTDVDGGTWIRKSLALKMARDPHTRRGIINGTIVKGSIRIMTPDGLIKGDANIAPDENLPANVYTSTHNIKTELATKRGYTMSFEPHHGSVTARTNSQILSWWPKLVPMDQARFTVKHFFAETMANLRAGKFPSYMTVLPKLKEGVDSLVLFRLTAHKWLAHGMRLNQSSGLLRQTGTAAQKQMLSDAPWYQTKNGTWKQNFHKQKVRVPITHAFYGHIMTDTLLALGGYGIPVGCKKRLFYHAESQSVVIPAKHFAKYYRHHGGWDLDDSVMVIVRKIAGKIKAILVRSPNSWGEYSVIDVELNGLPLHHEYGPIPKMAKADMPTQIHKLPKGTPLPTGTFVRGTSYDYADFDYALACARINPGTGAAINLLCIAYYSIFSTFNPAPLTDVEDIVDTTQQNPSLEGLQALVEYLEQAKAELLSTLLDGVPVDPLIFENRLNLSGEEKGEYRYQVNMVDGLFSNLKGMVEEETKAYAEELNAFSRVWNGKAIPYLFDETKTGGRDPIDFSNSDVAAVEGRHNEIWEIYKDFAAECGEIKANGENPAKVGEAADRCSTRMVEMLMSLPVVERDLLILGFLDYTYTYEKADSALFFTAPVIEGVIQPAAIDLVCEALVRHGIASTISE